MLGASTGDERQDGAHRRGEYDHLGGRRDLQRVGRARVNGGQSQRLRDGLLPAGHADDGAAFAPKGQPQAAPMDPVPRCRRLCLSASSCSQGTGWRAATRESPGASAGPRSVSGQSPRWRCRCRAPPRLAWRQPVTGNFCAQKSHWPYGT